jgi:hypothetical protein
MVPFVVHLKKRLTILMAVDVMEDAGHGVVDLQILQRMLMLRVESGVIQQAKEFVQVEVIVWIKIHVLKVIAIPIAE